MICTRSTKIMRRTLILIVLYMVNSVLVEGCPSECQCLQPNLVDCSEKLLTKIPSDIPNDVEVLDLGDNNLTSIPDGAFSSFSRLTFLSLYGNNIATISPKAFTGLNNVRLLNLRENRIKDLPSGLFSDTPLLNHVSLRQNAIAEIKDDVFVDLQNLTFLDLGHNDISELPANTFNSLSTMTVLDLSSNRVDRIDVNAFSGLTQLSELYLNDNMLTELSLQTFQEVRRLEVLHLDNNQLKSIPSFVKPFLPRLKVLLLHNNRIRSIPHNAFKGLKQLSSLDLAHNRIRVLSDRFFKADLNITNLDLTSNELDTLPAFNSSAIASFFGPSVSIHLKSNPIRVVGPLAFYGFKGMNLKSFTLDLSSGHLEDVHETAFEGVSTEHYELNFDKNHLQSINPGVFSALNNDYHHPMSDISNLITLRRNPWACDCNLQDFRKWLQENNNTVKLAGDLKCASPDDYVDIPILRIEQDDLVCSPPVFKEPSQQISTVEGDSVTLDCTVTGNPKPNVYWITPRGELSAQTTIHSDYYEVLANNNLQVLTLTMQHEGSYACVATNSQGSNIAIRYLEVGEVSHKLSNTVAMETGNKSTTPTGIPTVTAFEAEGTYAQSAKIDLGIIVGLFVGGIFVGFITSSFILRCNMRRKEKKYKKEVTMAEMCALRGNDTNDVYNVYR